MHEVLSENMERKQEQASVFSHPEPMFKSHSLNLHIINIHIHMRDIKEYLKEETRREERSINMSKYNETHI